MSDADKEKQAGKENSVTNSAIMVKEPSQEENDEGTVPIGKLKWSKDEEHQDELILNEDSKSFKTLETKEESHESKLDEQSKKNVKRDFKLVFKMFGLLFLFILVLIVSLIVGYTIIGDQPPGEIFNINMWKHMYNLLFG
jgi:hypothetical protein